MQSALKYDLNSIRYIAEFDIKNIDTDSVVVDIGGYEGNFSKTISLVFNPHIFIIEPANEFYNNLKKMFSNYYKIKVCNYAIGSSRREEILYACDDKSSFFQEWAEMEDEDYFEMVSVFTLSDFMKCNSINKIDLLKINVEGAEYEIIKQILDEKYTDKINNFLIQFHNIDNNSKIKYTQLITRLSDTHKLIWNKGLWVWEYWIKK